jgi:hypothetical protein
MNWIDAVGQFIEDYTMVMDNDHDAYRDLITTAKLNGEEVVGFADHLRNEWEDYVDQVAELCARQWGHEAPATLIVRQMLGGWGQAPFDRLARHYIELAQEAEVNV